MPKIITDDQGRLALPDDFVQRRRLAPNLFHIPTSDAREATMRVHVKLFATLRHFAPSGAIGLPFEVDLAEGATVADLIHHLSLPAEEVKMVYVNARARPEDWRLEPGDEIGIFPLIGGG